MSDDTFTYDEAGFQPQSQLGSVAIAENEARYADLVSEVVWTGTITPDGRQRLETARELFGLSPERAQQIEDAQIATQRVEVVEEPTVDDDPDVPEPTRPSVSPDSQVSPIAPSDDPRIRALQRRIIVVEDENDELAFENQSLKALVEQLENLVGQLQFALEETLDELHLVKLDGEPEVQAPAASMIQAVTEPEGDRSADASGIPPAEPSYDVPVDFAPDSGPSAPVESGPMESTEIPIVIEPGPSRPELPTLMGLGHDDLDDDDEAPDARPTLPSEPPSEVGTTPIPAWSMTTTRRRLRSHEDIAEVVDPVFAAAPAGMVRRTRDNPADLHRALQDHPRDRQLLHSLFASLGRAGDADRRFNVAQALLFLDEATAEERAHYERYVEAGLVRPGRAVDDGEWQEILFHPTEDRLTGAILAEIAPAVLLGQMTAIRQSIAPELLDPAQQVDHTTSTLQAVRCLRWGAAILGLATPPIYVVPEHEGCIDVVLNPRPSTRLGALALKGRRSRELAFEAGRHLSWYRREHLLGRPSRSVRRLEDMFLAALMMGNPGLPITSKVKARVLPIVQTIRPLLDATAVKALELGFARFVEEGGRTKLGRWLRGAERTAHRAGLLLCNDLWAAHHMLQLDDEVKAEPAIDDLLLFITSEGYAELRERLSIAVSA